MPCALAASASAIGKEAVLPFDMSLHSGRHPHIPGRKSPLRCCVNRQAWECPAPDCREAIDMACADAVPRATSRYEALARDWMMPTVRLAALYRLPADSSKASQRRAPPPWIAAQNLFQGAFHTLPVLRIRLPPGAANGMTALLAVQAPAGIYAHRMKSPRTRR